MQSSMLRPGFISVRPSSIAKWATLVWLLTLLGYANASQSFNWAALNADWGRFEGAPDQSALNEPIAQEHAIVVRGRHFVSKGLDQISGTADDKRVRLFGINLGGDACFPPKDKAEEVAATLRSLGFNAVRLHHLDTFTTDDPNVYQSSLTKGSYPSLNTAALERLRHFIAALKAQGIYINLNLMVGHVFRPDIDGVPALDDQGTPPGYGSPVHVFFPRMVALQTDYARQLIQRLELADEPVLAQVEIINESSLAAAWLHWDKTYWDKQIRGEYAKELDRQWQRWVEQTHGDLAAACKKWGTCASESGQMPTPEQAEALQHTMAADWWVRLKQKWRQWMASIQSALGLSPSAMTWSATAHPKTVDALKFVAETDRTFVEHMRAVVRAATRPDLPVTGTQMDFGAPLNFHSHRNMDYVDAHFYIDHPVFPGAPWSDSDWYFQNESISGREFGHLLSLAALRDHAKPFVVSEFNQPYPNTHGHDIFPVTAAFAAQQDWDGLFFYAYGGTGQEQGAPAHFFLQGDWAKASVVGLSARMFRTGSVPALSSQQVIESVPADWWSVAAIERRPDTWARHLNHRQLFTEANALSHAVSLSEAPVAMTKSTASPPPAVKRLTDERRVSIEADAVNALLGEVASRTPTVAGNLTVTVDSSEPRERTAAVLHSLDDLSVGKSKHLLLVMPSPITGAHVKGTQPQPQLRVNYRSEAGKWTLQPEEPGGSPSGSRTTVKPVWLHRQAVTVHIASPHSHAIVYPLTPNGQRLKPLSGDLARITHSGLELKLGQANAPTALWYEVVFQ